MNYFKEINKLIEEREVNKKAYELKDNYDTLRTNWEIGKLLYEAQGGKERAKYGDGLIKKWSLIFVERYGKNYNETNLKRYRQFYLLFQKGATLSHQLSWSHIVEILTKKNENERNYYINEVILNNLSVRELRKEIKNEAFNRLSYVDKQNIKLIENDNYELTIKDMIKDPIIISVKDNNDMTEKVLHKYIIDMLENKFLELGVGFTLAGHEYKLIINNRTYKIDLLFFNYELNSFVVVEIKTRELSHKDISQLKFYTEHINKTIKKNHHNKTIGLLIVKKNNKLVLEYCTDENMFVTTYKLLN